jgi:hypothetical protein
VERVEGIVGRLLHVEDLLDGPVAEALCELAADRPHLVDGQWPIEGDFAHRQPARVGDHDRQSAVAL